MSEGFARKIAVRPGVDSWKISRQGPGAIPSPPFRDIPVRAPRRVKQLAFWCKFPNPDFPKLPFQKMVPLGFFQFRQAQKCTIPTRAMLRCVLIIS